MSDLIELPDPRVAELLDKQMNRYQAIVARLASNSVQVKTWCVTAVGAIAALGVESESEALFGVALAILAVFMVLDVQYLWLERRFRDGAHALVQRVANNEVAHLREYFETRPPPRAERSSVLSVLGSFAIWPFYLVSAGLLTVGVLSV